MSTDARARFRAGTEQVHSDSLPLDVLMDIGREQGFSEQYVYEEEVTRLQGENDELREKLERANDLLAEMGERLCRRCGCKRR